jgi:glycosyltransferase involved in cell wall biosynthesis
MEKLLVEFARFTDRRQFDLHFVSLERKGRVGSEIDRLQWPVHSFDKREGLRPLLVLKLARTFRKLRPSVVHTHNTPALIYGSAAATLARVPRIIHTRHGQRYGASSRETRVFRLLSKLAYRVVSVSQDAYRLSVAEGIHSERACWIHNGVDLSRFSYVGPRQDGPAMVVARLSPEKDIATLLRAMKHIIHSCGPGQQALRLEIVGDGPDRNRLESLARALGLAGSIRFLGERSDVPRLLANAGMVILPSLTEGISLTLLEAMARGLPVIATRVGGNPEVVVGGETGLLVAQKDPKGLADAIASLQRDPQRGREMGWRGRQRVEQKFSVQRMIRQYERLYLDEA